MTSILRFILAASLASMCLINAVSAQGDAVEVKIDGSVTPDKIEKKGEDATLMCQVSGINEGDYKPVSWFKNDKPVVPTADKYIMEESNNTLQVLDIGEEDIGPYVCAFTLNNNQLFNKTVNIESVPHVNHFDRSKNQLQGDPLVLECHAWGFPIPILTWIKQHEGELPQVINVSDSRVSFENISSLIDARLRIADLEYEDRAEYICQAVNVHGNYTASIMVRVKDKLAALWPFLGICAEVAILCIIIFIYEKRRAKKMEEEEAKEEADHLTNSNDHKGKDEIRQRK
jgi:hypothetical protein